MTVPGKLAMNILVGLLWVVTMAGCNTDADQDCIPCPEEPPQAQPLGQEISRHFSEAFPTLAGSLFNLPLEVKLSLMEGDYREKAIAAGKIFQIEEQSHVAVRGYESSSVIALGFGFEFSLNLLCEV